MVLNIEKCDSQPAAKNDEDLVEMHRINGLQ